MNVTVSRPGKMSVEPNHINNGRTLVYATSDDDDRAITLWISAATAAQWIETLTPIAEAKP